MTDFRGGIVGCYVEIFVVGGDNEARNLLTTVASQRGSGGEITFREHAVGIECVARRIIHEVGAGNATTFESSLTPAVAGTAPMYFNSGSALRVLELAS